jgi:perosamine synthetase
MSSPGTENATSHISKQMGKARLRRCIASLGGTTTLADCLVALRYLIDPRQLVRGPAIAEYEQAFAQQIGVRYACSFSAGRVGLYGLLRAFGVGEGDEVLLQVPTHIVIPNAIRYLGALPVYVDCRLDTYNMDLDQAERRITSRTKVLILQHTFGIPADLDAALALARRHGLEVIEDCVHALGSTYDGRQVGSFRRAAFFSTEETKTISSTMGGMIVTDDPELARQLRRFRDECAWPSAWLTARYLLKLVVVHLLAQPNLYSYSRPIYQFMRSRQWHPLPMPTTRQEMQGVRPAHYLQRLSNSQAALALRQLDRLASHLAHRRAIANLYRARLSAHGLDVPEPPPKADPVFVRYPIWADNRESVVRTVAPYAVLGGSWFSSVLEEAKSPAHGGYEMGSCPRAEAAAEHLVNLPTHPRVERRDAEAIASAVARMVVLEDKKFSIGCRAQD